MKAHEREFERDCCVKVIGSWSKDSDFRYYIPGRRHELLLAIKLVSLLKTKNLTPAAMGLQHV